MKDWQKIYEEAVKTADRVIDQHLAEAAKMSDSIYKNPELGGQEHRTSGLMVEALRGAGYGVEYPALGLDTAFVGEYDAGKDGVVAILAEMDALPEIGHACGHNLHGVMSVLCGIGTAAAIKEAGIAGKIMVVGSPAEETDGSKVAMSKSGIFDQCDLAMMIHCYGGSSFIAHSCLAMDSYEFIFHGQTSHAAAQPWIGRNALNGVQLFFHAIDMLRQHVKPEVRMHGIIKDGGQAPNIVPDRASAHFYFRAPTRRYLDTLTERVFKIVKGIAAATETSVEWHSSEASFDEMMPNARGEELIGGIMEELGVKLSDVIAAGSTDMGNVSQRCAALHPMLDITAGEKIAVHTREFAAATVTPEAHRMLAIGAKAMARTALRVMTDSDTREAIKAEFEKNRAQGE